MRPVSWKRFIWLWALWLLALLVIGCAAADTEQDARGGEKGPFRIGVMESLTGPGETYGNVAVRAKQMAVDEINAAGGIGGRMLELIVEDSQCSAKGSGHRLPKADRRRWREDHPGNLLQRRHAWGCPAGGGRRGYSVFRAGEQPGHRQRGRLHLSHPDQRR